MSPGERETPSEGAVRNQMREMREADPAPASGGEHRAAPQGAPGQGAGTESEVDGDPGAAFVAAPGGPAEDEAVETGSADAGADGGEAVEPDSSPLAEVERQRDEYLALAQRTQADFDNFRRRAARDAAAAGPRAKAGLVRELLPALDNLERALAAAGEAEEGLASGVRMVHGELVGSLGRSGVASYEPRGEPFDPTVHEAVSTRPADGTQPGVVVEVLEKGYRLDDTVLRPARVIVSA